MASRWPVAKGVLCVGALVGLGFALLQLNRADQGLDRRQLRVGHIPVELFLPREASAPRPAVILAHGFSACRQYMYPFAYTLARNGYVAAVFDFSGHGKNSQPFPTQWSAIHSARSPLTYELEMVISYVRGLPTVDPARLALLGHSMGAGVVTRYARDHDEIAATIAVSLVFSDVLPTKPRNLLLLVGAWEGEPMQTISRAAWMAARGDIEGDLSGDLAMGTARKLVAVPNAEHASIAFNPVALRETLTWLDGTFDHSSSGEIDRRILWIGLFYLCAAILFLPFSRVVLSGPLGPQKSEETGEPEGIRLELTGVLLVSLVPAIAVPIVLKFIPIGLLPLAVGSYMVAFFWLYGLLAVLILIVLRALSVAEIALLLSRRAILAALLSFLYCAVTFGLLTEHTLLSTVPIVRRLPIIGAAFLLVAPYFLVGEYLSRSRQPRPWLFLTLLTKGLLLASLCLGIWLGGSFVLMLFLPGIAILLVGATLFARRIYNLTESAGAGGLFIAFVFAWLLGALFPVL